MADNEIAIRVENVSKDFVLPHEKINSLKSLFTSVPKRRGKKAKETQHALKDISFEIKKGEFFGIVGRNGSGKSTLLKILANIYQPTSGKTYAQGKLVPFIELGVGFNPELTGRENVYLNGAMLGFSHKEVEAMYDSIVEFAELERFMDQKLKNYSSGMQVRLAFSMAVRAEADILLIDEVLAVGDADFQRKCFSYFHQLKKQHKTVIFVSHDMGAIREYCDRALLIEKSKVLHEGTGEKIADFYTRLFFDKPSSTSESQEQRWGDGKAKISDVKVTPDVLTDDSEKLELKWKVKALHSLEYPIHGFVIKNPNGTNLVGTNTKLSNVKTDIMQKGDVVSVEWALPNIFSEGIYSVVPAVVAADNTVHDWWEEAAHFEVKRNIRSPYPVQPDVSAVIKKASQ